MSAIYGMVDFGGAPVDRTRFESMGRALDAFGPDGSGDWRGDEAALGRRLLATGHGPLPDPRPFRLGNLVVAAAARLDNREELALALDLGPAQRSSLGDSEIVAECCRKWGDDAPRRMFGDWAYAAWDRSAKRLVLARDHFGNTALYYHHDGRRLTFGSSRKALFAWAHVPRRLNELRLAQHLSLWITDGAATMHEGIFRLPPGHVLTASAAGIAVSRYWHPEQLPELRLASNGDYVEQFLSLYSAAVRTRMSGADSVATTLSGGWDSGSVTALAALEARRTGQVLTAFTVDEWPLARQTAHLCEPIRHRSIFAEAITPLQAMRLSLDAHDEPEYAVANLDWIHDLLGSAREQGARIVLTGQAGNGSVSWGGDRHWMLRLLLRGRIGQAARELRAWRAQAAISAPRAVWRHTVSPLRTMALGKAYRRGLRGPPPAGRGLINPHFDERMRIGERMRDSGFDPFFSRFLSARDQRFGLLLPEISPMGAQWHEKGAAHGVDVRDPTADLRLLEFCLAIPDEQFRLDGVDRSLFRRALEDLLPAEVLSNRRPGRQAADFADRLRADADAMDGAVGLISASPAACEYLDVPVLRDRWRRIRADLGVPIREALAFGRSVQFGLFLAKDL